VLAGMIYHYIFPENMDVEKEQYVTFPLYTLESQRMDWWTVCNF
jgi:hypothetical protein